MPNWVAKASARLLSREPTATISASLTSLRSDTNFWAILLGARMPHLTVVTLMLLWGWTPRGRRRPGREVGCRRLAGGRLAGALLGVPGLIHGLGDVGGLRLSAQHFLCRHDPGVADVWIGEELVRHREGLALGAELQRHQRAGGR